MPHFQLHPLVLSLVFDAVAVEPTRDPEPVADTSAATREIEPVAIRLDLDLSTLPAEDVEHFEPAIRDASDPLLDHERFLVTADTPHQLVIHVALLDPAALDYALDFEVRPNGRLIAAPTDRIYCRICAQAEVVEHVAQGLPHALSALRAAATARSGARVLDVGDGLANEGGAVSNVARADRVGGEHALGRGVGRAGVVAAVGSLVGSRRKILEVTGDRICAQC